MISIELKSHFLRLYQIAFSDDNFDMSLPPDPPLSTSSYHLIFNYFCPNIGGNYTKNTPLIFTHCIRKNPPLLIEGKRPKSKRSFEIHPRHAVQSLRTVLV
jgi:hypothetical protein